MAPPSIIFEAKISGHRGKGFSSCYQGLTSSSAVDVARKGWASKTLKIRVALAFIAKLIFLQVLGFPKLISSENITITFISANFSAQICLPHRVPEGSEPKFLFLLFIETPTMYTGKKTQSDLRGHMPKNVKSLLTSFQTQTNEHFTPQLLEEVFSCQGKIFARKSRGHFYGMVHKKDPFFLFFVDNQIDCISGLEKENLRICNCSSIYQDLSHKKTQLRKVQMLKIPEYQPGFLQCMHAPLLSWGSYIFELESQLFLLMELCVRQFKKNWLTSS